MISKARMKWLAMSLGGRGRQTFAEQKGRGPRDTEFQSEMSGGGPITAISLRLPLHGSYSRGGYAPLTTKEEPVLGVN